MRLCIGAALPLGLLVLGAACSESAPRSVVVHAAPDRGFHYPYILSFPAGELAETPGFLLVEPNNTGSVSDDIAVHLKAARALSQEAIGGYVSRALKIPLLVPVFPRPEEQWSLYTHLLDRDVMTLQEGPMARLDLQLLAMVDDAIARLEKKGYSAGHQVLVTGFSASGTFANRFTVLHPERVRAVASGGVNGLLMLPIERLAESELPYPLGVADYASIAGRPFNLPVWRQVPQFIYMGAKDENDAVLFDDGYSKAEREIIFGVLGERMQPDRWMKCQGVYRTAGARVTFRTFPDVGHRTDRRINGEIVEFFRAAMDGPESSRGGT